LPHKITRQGEQLRKSFSPPTLDRLHEIAMYIGADGVGVGDPRPNSAQPKAMLRRPTVRSRFAMEIDRIA